MSDLLKRLRGRFELSDALYRLNNEAADALEAQQAEIERLRKDAERWWALRASLKDEADRVALDACIDAAKEKT